VLVGGERAVGVAVATQGRGRADEREGGGGDEEAAGPHGEHGDGQGDEHEHQEGEQVPRVRGRWGDGQCLGGQFGKAVGGERDRALGDALACEVFSKPSTASIHSDGEAATLGVLDHCPDRRVCCCV